jgi:D-alanyl-D-alanine carboxypeptidase (penicillin-binding protein 5/6)
VLKRKNRLSLIVSASMFLQLCLVAIHPSAVKAADPIDLKLNVKSAILMEATTGQVLFEYNADEALPPASMAKMMTEYLVLDAVNSGKIKETDMVTTSQYAADVIGSGDLLALNEKASVKDMFAAMSIYSGNDATVALAEHVGGTEENFAKMMNQKARDMGLSDTANFINSTGLSRADLGKYAPKELQGETMLTARDAALIAYYLIRDHKELLNITKIPSQKFRERDKSPMINNVNFRKYSYQGLDGLKTGHTDEAGYCFTGTAERNGFRLISVVMGTKTEPMRFEETRKVLDYGFTNFETKPLLTAKAEIEQLQLVNIKKGVATQVPVVTQTGATFIAKKGATPDQFKMEAAPLEESKLVAPIKKGDVLGTLTITYEGTTKTVNMIANEDVEKGSWFRLFFRAIGNFFSDLLKGSDKG